VLDRAYVNSSGPGFSLHSDIVIPYICNYGTKEQVEKYIPRMIAGSCIGAIAMTEPGAGRYDFGDFDRFECKRLLFFSRFNKIHYSFTLLILFHVNVRFS